MAASNIHDFDAFERLSGSLEDFAAENGHFRAMCPVHGGHRPALTVAVEGKSPNRKILLHCHAECGKQEILDALGLEKKDLFERPRTKDSKKLGPIVATYDYVNLAGALVTQTTRHYPPKDFRQRRPDGNGGWIWSIKGVEPVLYNLPAIMRTILDGGTVFVVEGEKDCDRANEVLKEAGVFTTCPMGSKKWRGSYTQTLRGANVVLIPDNDGPGKEHISQVGSALLPVAKSVKVLELPGVPDSGGDLSDWLDTGGNLEAFQTLVAATDLFKSNSDPTQESDLNKSLLPIFKVGEIKERSKEDLSAGWYCPLFMKAGEITLFGGEAKKSGKTTFFMHALKATHDGVPFLGMPTVPTKSLVLTEQGNNILEATAKAGIQDEDNIYIASFRDVSKERWPALIEKAVETCKVNNLGILVIDTFAAFARLRGSDENLSGEILERMEPIIEAARVHGLHVSLLHHTGKDGEIRGSSAFNQEPDVIWVLKRPPGDHGPTVRALEGLGRHDAVNTTFNISLEERGYVPLGTSGQIEGEKARGALLEEIPFGKSAARRRTEVLSAVAHVTSAASLQRALENLIDKGTVRSEKLKEKGSPTVLWRTGLCTDRTNGDLFKSDPRVGSEFDLNKSKAPVETAEGLGSVVESLRAAGKVALDLETMPPEGWVLELAGEYKTWRRSLKTKPPEDRRRKKWADLKEKTYKRYATDIETARVRLVSLATPEGLNEVVDATRVGIASLLDVLKDKTLITHNGAFDLGILRERYGYVHDGKVLDTQLLYLLHHYAEDGDRSQLSGGKWRVPDPLTTKIDFYGTGKKTIGMSSLAVVAKRYLGVSLDKGHQASDWSVPDLTPEQVSYARMDTKVLLELSATLTRKLEALGMGAVVDLESRAFAAQIDMQLNGFPADVETAEKMAEKYRTEGEEALKEMNALLPQETTPEDVAWNWNKAGDIRTVLRLLGADIDHEGYPKTEKTGEPSTSTTALVTIEDPEPAAKWVASYLKYLGIHKRYRDFASKYAGLIKEGRIRGRFATISTGRLNCQKPNLQQVPKRGHLQTLEGMRIRDIFRPKEGDVFVVADFAQVELLLAATIAQRATGMEGHMIRVFEDARVDIHTETAASMLKKPVEDVVKEERTLAKAVNFGLIYGAEAETLLEYARNNYGVKDMNLEDARHYRTAFFERYPELAQWHHIVEKGCHLGDGFSVTPLGRRRKLPKWASSKAIASTTAKNSPVQGAGADAIKLTLARLFEDRHNCPGNPRLNCCIHDEVVLSVVEEHEDAAVLWVKKHMAAAEREAVGDLKNPIVIDVEAKYSWGG